MKAEPFKSSNHKDKHYSVIAEGNYEAFWKIFAGHCNPTNQFKGNSLFNLDLIQRLFDPNPKTRIDLAGVKKHPWFLGDMLSMNDYKK